MNRRGIGARRGVGRTRGVFHNGAMNRPLRALLLLLTLSAALAHADGAAAQATPKEPEQKVSATFFDEAMKQIADMRAQLVASGLDTDELIQLRNEAGRLAGTADGLLAERIPRLEAVDARLAELGDAPAKGEPAEAADIVAQREALERQRSALDAEIKRAKLVVADGQQLAGEVAEARRNLFRQQISQRTTSPLLPAFWRDVAAASPRDLSRLAALRDAVGVSLAASFDGPHRVPSFAGIAIGLLLLVFGRWWVERLWLRTTADKMPHGRLRRSALALTVLVVSTILPGLGAHAIYLGLNWHDVFVEPFAALARVFVNTVYFGGLVTGLGRALLSANRPSWRLAPIADAVAARLRHFPFVLAVVVVLGFMLNRVNSVIGTSLAATIAASFVVAVLYALTIAVGLAAIQRAQADGDAEVASRPAWVMAALGLATAGVVATLGSASFGYVAFAAFVSGQLIWIPLVGGVFYVLVCVVEDAVGAMLSERSRWVRRTTGMTAQKLGQVEVLLSGVFRLFMLACAIALVLAPLGTGPDELLSRGSRFGNGFAIGQLRVTPSAVFGAIAVFVIGLMLLRAAKAWFDNRFLPTTRFDPGLRTSISTLLGYAGGILVFAFALSALGLSVERIAWVASALSVGIGFGLQAIVQNFISGLILLVERPVKVGDWVALGELEGDIRRINVRATEIQMGDRSTVIVPNSELITKTVRNITLANAEGRVRVRLALPIENDARRVREVALEAIQAQPGILRSPEPGVLLDGIDGGNLVFFLTAYVDSPRNTGGIRSALLIDLLERLRAAGIALSAPQEISLRGNAGPSPADAAGPATTPAD